MTARAWLLSVVVSAVFVVGCVLAGWALGERINLSNQEFRVSIGGGS